MRRIPIHVLHTGVLAVLVMLAAGCAKELPDLEPSQVPEPAPDEVESVVFLFGDAGYADLARNPVLRILAADIELWSGRIAQDSGVAVLFLGDIVYPLGLRVQEEYFARDSAIVHNQVKLLAGPNAREYGALGYFLAGNHDWGEARNEEGVRRLQNLELFLNRRRLEGVQVRLQPEAGEPGPALIDLRSQARLLLFDTAWWLLAEDEYLKRRSFQQTEDAIRSTGEDRFIIAAAHHPFESAGTHSGLIPFWKAFGVRYLLTKSGALLQDLTSIVYRELAQGMLEAFRPAPPLLFAGGHDHNIQVISHEGWEPGWPQYTVVSGSGSKVSSVGHIDGMLYRHAAPGYIRVVTHRNGRVDLFVIDAPDESYLECPGEGAALEQCMAERTAAFRTSYSMRLR